MKILIVDDELPIREWIKFVIEQLETNDQVIGLASDGEEALKFYHEEHPDIIFVDILMPDMDGMQFIEAVREVDSAVEIVVLTSHDVFEYARNVMRFGINQYILKTEISKECIRKILQETQKHLDIKASMQRPDLDFISMERTAFFHRLVDGGMEEPISQKSLSGHEIQIRNAPLFAVAFRPEIHTDKFNFSMPEDAGIENAVGFVYDKNINVLLCNIIVSPSMLIQIYQINNFTQKIATLNQFHIGVSNLHPGWGQIRNAILEAVYQLKMVFYGGHTSPLLTNEIDDILRRQKELEQSLEARKRDLMQRMKSEQSEDLRKDITQYMEEIKQQRPVSEDFVKRQLSSLLNGMFEHKISEPAALSDALEKIRAAETFSQVSDSVLHFMRSLPDKDLMSGRGYSRAVVIGMNYVKENYSANCSLEMVADQVHLNPDYFSRLFKKETGVTFVTYLTLVRVTRAANLLKTTDSKVYEVAEQVGYSNISHFSSVFKRRFGVNPFEYRNNVENVAEMSK